MKRFLCAALASLMMLSTIGTAFADVYSDSGFIKKIPMKPKYSEACQENGTVERLTYTTHAYALEAVANGEAKVDSFIAEGVLPDCEFSSAKLRGLS